MQRVEGLGARLAAGGDRREGPGAASLAGGGEEFFAHRPYRPGEDLRRLDWSLLARLDRPFVRVTRREATQRWFVLLDASASLGIGEPSKLQLAAEAAAAVGLLALRAGAEVELVVSAPGGPEELLARPRDARALVRFLDGRRAGGPAGAASLLAAARLRGGGRVVLVGDLLDLTPGALASLVRRGRSLGLVQVLAPEELDPPRGEAVEWWDPETGERFSVEVDHQTAAAYRRLLEHSIEGWRSHAARHGHVHGVFVSTSPFEDVVRPLLEALR